MSFITVLADGETFSQIEDSHIVPIEDGMSTEDIEEMLGEDTYSAYELRNTRDMIQFMVDFFGMSIEKDNDGQLVIYTGVTE